LGVFDLPLRLPRQYADKETNLHYNYFRDYDPSIGRYGESDPIGLRGGLNTYAYVGNRPLRLVDPLGLETCVLITRGTLGFGNHSALYMSRGSDSGGAALYDPSGSYARTNNRGGGDMIFDEAADPAKFAEFHRKQFQDTTEMACKPTTEKEERRLFERALDEGPKAGPYCSTAVSNVLSGSPYFPNVEAGTFFPGNLFRATK
jgi:RHS repeat-associated protein